MEQRLKITKGNDMRDLQSLWKDNKYFCLFIECICLIGGCFQDVFLYLAGLFALFGIWLMAYKNRGFYLDKRLKVFLAMLLGSSILSLCTSVDRGMDVIGILRTLCIVLVGVYFIQVLKRTSDVLLNSIPYIAVSTLFVSLIGCILPMWRNCFWKTGRLAGTFGYSNTYALFLLIGVIIQTDRMYKNRTDDKKLSEMPTNLIIIAGLLIGLVLTKSRAVLGIAIAYYITWGTFLYLTRKQRKNKKSFALFQGQYISLLVLFATILTLMLCIGLSLGSSTFWGRLLYIRDMFPQMITHPLGTGYLGFYYMQAAIQTGVYDTTFLHNSILQLASDYGFLCFGAFIYLVVSGFQKSQIIALQNRILIILVIHFIFDFDLEFLPIWIILFLCVSKQDDQSDIKKNAINKSVSNNNSITQDDQKKSKSRLKYVSLTLSGCIAIVLIWFIAIEGLSMMGRYELVQTYYPYHTENNLRILEEEQDFDKAEVLADHILKQNPYAFLAWEMKALVAANRGEWKQAIENQTKVTEVNRYEKESYVTLLAYLQKAAIEAAGRGETDLAKNYVMQMKKMPQVMQQVLDHTSILGRKIKDKPDLYLDDNVLEYLESL